MIKIKTAREMVSGFTKGAREKKGKKSEKETVDVGFPEAKE